MEIRKLGTRYKENSKVNFLKHQPYDYESEGLLKTCLPEVVYNTRNKTTRFMIKLVETCLVFCMKYVDELKYFKDWNRKQY